MSRAGATLGSDGMWLTESNTDDVGRITPAGVITEFHTPSAPSQSTSIVAGPDGNLWFVEKGGNNVGRITTTGVITEFPIPTPYSDPTRGWWSAPTAPSDSPRWAAAGSGGVTMAGEITEFPTGDPEASSLLPSGWRRRPTR